MRNLKGVYGLLFFLVIINLVFSFNVIAQAININLPKVVIVTTGGTIAEKESAQGGAVPALTGKDLIEAVPGLSKVADVEVVNFTNIDSSQMTPQIWANLSKKVDEVLKDKKVKGVVVTHGTDTMAEGAYFLELTLKSKKPVVFVGAMRDASDLSPDGPANILNAVIQVCSSEAQDWGVTVTLNQYVNSAKNVRKTQTTNVQTFDSGEHGYLGYIALGKVYKYNESPPKQKFDIPAELPAIAIINDYAGSNGDFIRYAVNSGIEGIIVEGVGAGNVNSQMNNAIKYAISKKIPVVITTKVYHGGVFPIYGDEGGGETLKKEKAILAGDITSDKARILLMLALGNGIKDIKELEEIFCIH
jgi:L-asparaginase